MTNDPFRDARRQFRQAKSRTAGLKRSIETFLKKKPYATVTELDADGVTKLLKIKMTRQIPSTWDPRATEILDALKSALDMTAYAATVASGTTVLRNTNFPIAGSKAEWPNAIKKNAKHVPRDILAFFETFEPYKGGAGAAIWAMNNLRNTRHTKLATVGNFVGGINIDRGIISGPAKLFMFPKWDRNKNELIYASTTDGG